MTTALPERDEVLSAIRATAQSLGRPPSRAEFKSSAGMTEYQVLKHFPSWREAVRSAGLEPHSTNVPINPEVLLEDWGEFVRRVRRIPTRDQYRRDGTYSPGVFERRFGPWLAVPLKFREFANGKPEWADVVALLPIENARAPFAATSPLASTQPSADWVPPPSHRHSRLDDRPTYGNPIDFRGLRHEPVNEQGVVFLFGMVARERAITSRPSRLGTLIAKPSGKAMRVSGSACASSLSSRAATSETTGTIQTVAMCSCAGVTTGPSVRRPWKLSSSARSFARFRHPKNEETANNAFHPTASCAGRW